VASTICVVERVLVSFTGGVYMEGRFAARIRGRIRESSWLEERSHPAVDGVELAQVVKRAIWIVGRVFVSLGSCFQ
jgi:hypothetical protein